MKPKLVIISDTIRRDLHHPLTLFSKFDVIHYYRSAGYGDMNQADFASPRAERFSDFTDLYNKLTHLKPDIIQAAEPWANQSSFKISHAVWQFVKKNKTIVVMPVFENIPIKNKLPFYKCILSKWLLKRLDRFVSVYFVLNRGARKNLIDLGVGKGKFSDLIWGSWGIDLSDFNSNKFKLQASSFKLLFLGRVSTAKGIPQLLEAFKIVQAEIPGAKLTIAGPAGDASNLDQLTATPGVAVKGAVKNLEVPDLLSTTRILVMPSQDTKTWQEQVGMVGLQALACGIPVVTTNSGSIPEYFKNNLGAQIVDQNDVGALAKSILKLLSSNSFYQEQSSLGAKYIKDNFDVTKQVEKIERLLLTLLEPSHK